ncbi:hypothetical protein NEISICOT_00963 [Neisseria sicca ATCC 29256]|uniref:Uncharacterized protein n=1 Tax=Neisseria sicca ATCC 29256 TaxID=547045 RepID=C6M372_NEISI|nr:hypothetical protein NEISICOT_00963 [Neisseria sicca ATCC 29256]
MKRKWLLYYRKTLFLAIESGTFRRPSYYQYNGNCYQIVRA